MKSVRPPCDAHSRTGVYGIAELSEHRSASQESTGKKQQEERASKIKQMLHPADQLVVDYAGRLH